MKSAGRQCMGKRKEGHQNDAGDRSIIVTSLQIVATGFATTG